MSSSTGAGKKLTPASFVGSAVAALTKKVVGTKSAPPAPLYVARRRLSVVSDNKLIEGEAAPDARDVDDVASHASESVVRCYAGVTKKGYAPYNPRKLNQDALLMEEDRPTNTLLFGVFDGHGEAGHLVSHYFSERLPGRLPAHPQWGSDPAAAISAEVDRLEQMLIADPAVDTEFSGTTAVVGTVRNRTLAVANIGDSRCIIGRSVAPSSRMPRRASLGVPAVAVPAAGSAARGGGGSAAAPSSTRSAAAAAAPTTTVAGAGLIAVEVTSDHKPDRPDEARRIIERGGRVFAVEYDDGVDGPQRVWLGHMDIPGLAMSRSLCDSVAHTAGVISAAEVTVVELDPADKVIVWASDGLWEFMSNQEVIDIIAGFVDPRHAVDALVTAANARWMKEEQVIDDTTVIVAFLDVPPMATTG